MSTESFYERAGGQKTFNDLTSHFYALVAVNPVLRPMYPESDLHGAARRLQLFLEQYWGGPTTYSQERGHPRLRMRHGQFRISKTEHDAWISCMQAAVEVLEIADDLKSELWQYLTSAAAAMVNAAD
ncbi:MAG: globin [Actinobacteria bacterium]|nr:globin [Actinomycetota bacterium]